MEKEFKFMELAKTVANFSKDPSTKVGAIALDQNLNVIAIGYNGPPRGVKDDPSRTERPIKYFFAAHAESNVVAQSAYGGRSLDGATLLVTPLFPCTHCAKMIIQSGIKRVICESTPNERWTEEAHYAKIMFEEAQVEVINVKKVDRPDGSSVWEAVSSS